MNFDIFGRAKEQSMQQFLSFFLVYAQASPIFGEGKKKALMPVAVRWR